MTTKKNMKPLAIFEHVMGATLMVCYLVDQGMDVELSDDADEGSAMIMIREDQYEKGREIMENRIKEIKSTYSL